MFKRPKLSLFIRLDHHHIHTPGYLYEHTPPYTYPQGIFVPPGYLYEDTPPAYTYPQGIFTKPSMAHVYLLLFLVGVAPAQGRRGCVARCSFREITPS